MRVVRALGEVCRELRLAVNKRQELPEHDYQAVTSLLSRRVGRDPRTLKNFEEGISTPTRLDDVVAGYSEASGEEVSKIWKEALARAGAAADAAARVAEAADEISRAARSAGSERGRKRGGGRNRGAAS